MITIDTKVSKVLAQYPEALDVFLKASPAFAKLKNPVMRKMLTPRVTVAQAAKIAGITPLRLLAELKAACGLDEEEGKTETDEMLSNSAMTSPERPVQLANLAPEKLILVDVREDIKKNIDPFKKIMTAVKHLQAGQVIHLVNVFEPVPLYDVLAQRGLEHWTEQIGGDWHIYFYPSGIVSEGNEKEDSNVTSPTPKAKENFRELDVSGLEPPEPMMKILATLPTLGKGTSLVVHHHREPKMLYQHLTDRGYEWETTQLAEDSYRIVIRLKEDD